ncbi:unnamed protein product [Scytosiphon promiscuus]
MSNTGGTAWYRGGVPHFGEREAVLALAVALPLGALVLGFCRRGKKSSARARSMSFGSGYMSIGSWPKDIKMSDPIITAFMFLEGTPQKENIEEACSTMLLHFHNFKSLPVRRQWSYSTRFEWQEIEVDPSDVVTWTKADGSAAVLAEMDRLKDAPLRQTGADGRILPMWGMHVIENTGEEEAGVGTVLAFRVHHTLGDGMSMVAVSRSVLETAAGEKVEMNLGRGAGDSASSAVVRPANRGLSHFSAAEILRGVRDVIVLSTAGPDTPLPFGHFEGPVSGGGSAAAHRRHEGGLFSSKRGAFSARRRTVLLPDLPLSLVKKIKDVSATTVNDVVMSLISGCVRRYSEAEGVASDFFSAPGFTSRALIPVALPRPSPSSGSAILCNKWAFVSMKLSVEETDPAARLLALKATTAKLKRSPTAGLQYMMQTYVLPYLPLWVVREMVHGALATHTVAVSNVPGPQEAVKFAGVGLRSVHFAFSNIMPQVGVVSLDGKMAINFVIDPISVPDSSSLSTHFLDELEALTGALGLEVSAEISTLRAEAEALERLMAAALSL